MKTRNLIFAVLAMVAVALMFSGCAVNSAKGVLPNLNNPSGLAEKNITTKFGDRLNITAYPITTKEEAKKYFDDDIEKLGIRAIFAQIQSHVEGDIILSATLNLKGEDGNTILMQLPMSPDEVFALLERPYLDKAGPWFLFTYGVGGLVSAGATKYTNIGIKEDLKGGKLLTLGPIQKETRGFLCYKVPDYVFGFPGSLKIVIKRGEKKLDFDIDVGRIDVAKAEK